MSQLGANKALQNAPAGPSVAVRSLNALLSFVLGLALYIEIPDITKMLGAIIVLSSICAIAYTYSSADQITLASASAENP